MILKFKSEKVKIDVWDIHYFESYKWYIHRSGNKKYLRGYISGDRSSGLKYLHKLILPGVEVDHINGNSLDNRRSNLRLCKRYQNNGNRRDLGSKGVHFDKRTQKYRAEISCNGSRFRLGRFKNFEDAKEAYNKKAAELFGEFARFIDV